MESCLLKNETVYAFTVVDNYHEERKLRKAGEVGELVCPGCSRPVLLRYGQIIRPYFAHKQDDVSRSCSYSEESMTHILGKEILYNYFRSKYEDVNLRFDYKLPIGRKPNLYCSFADGHELAVEFQRSNMRVTEWEERHQSYKDNNINVVWIVNFSEGESANLEANEYVDFFKKMVLYDTDNKLLLLNVKNKILTVCRNVEYHIGDKSYNLGLIRKEYPLDTITINPDGTIPCDLDDEYDKKYSELKQMVDNMLEEEEARLKAEASKKADESKKAEASIEPEKSINVLDKVKAIETNSNTENWLKQKWALHHDVNINWDNDIKLRTMKKTYINLLNRAANGDSAIKATLRKAYNENYEIRSLIKNILDENNDMAIRLHGFFM